MNFETYRETIKEEIRELMNSDPVVKLKFKALNNNKSEEEVEQLVLDGYMLDLTPDEVVQQIKEKAGS
jgi:hypothetical protein